jgi:adenylate cyclase
MSKAKGKAATDKLPQQRKGVTRTTFTIGLAVTLLVLLLSALGVMDVVEYKTVDWRFNQRGPRPMVVQGAVVAIDDESMNGWMDSNGKNAYLPERWIWPRDFWAVAIKNLKEAGAKVIAFDIVYSESSKRDPKQDRAFAAAAKEAGNVVFAERHVIKSMADDHAGIKTETLIPLLSAAAMGKGHIVVGHTKDGYLREFMPLFYNSSGDLDPDKPNIDLEVLRHLKGIKEGPRYDAAHHAVVLGSQSIPLNADQAVIVDFAGPAQTVPTIPFHDVYYKTADMSVFKDRVVYIGSTSEILHDNHAAPFSPNGDMPGVEAHIHFLDTLLNQQYLWSPGAGMALLLVLLLGALTTALTYRINAVKGFLVSAALMLLYIAVCVAAFVFKGWILPMSAPLVAVVLPYTALATYRAYREEKEARNTRRMFSRYVSKQIVEEIMKNPDAVKLGGEMKEATILFSDVRGFTAMSEKLSAPQVVEVLNEYLTAMVDVVIANNGTLDKYVGDAIMAVWGSPLPDPQHKQNAMRTAVQMMEVLQELQAKWAAEGKPHIDIGIGLNTGHVVAGNMGHHDFKMDYTVIGDDVNLAARMESANKEMRSHVLITGSSYEGCEDLVDVIKHEPIHVKGKEAAIEVYEVIGWKKQGRAPWAVPLSK